MKKGTLVIFRHGQTDYNKNHLMTGQADVPLTALGEEQAREAGRLIEGLRFDHAYSSTLSRAFNTAALALSQTSSNPHLKKSDGTWHIVQDADIIEVHAGDFTGRNYKNDPEIVAFRRRYDKPVPGGESQMQVVERVGRFFENEVLPKLARGENVLVVCHAGIVRAFDFVLGTEKVPADGGGNPNKKRIPNATPTVYEYEDGKLKRFFQIDNPKEIDAANQNTGHPSNAARPPKNGG